jgi:predicted O-methyltransferase YrrM
MRNHQKMDYGRNIPNEVIFSVLRTLKRSNPGDLYYESYLTHLAKRGKSFLDTYHFMWEWAIENHPKRILEIGVRTGISLCQLLSAYIYYEMIEKIHLCDVFNDGYCTPGLVQMNLRYLNIPDSVLDKIEWHIGDSKQTIPEIRVREPDLLFDYILVDGSHDPVDARMDLELVYPIVAPGGVILFDDIGPDGMNLLPVWLEFKHSCQDEFTWFENQDGKGLGVAIKK